jgi:acetaldehyde dehydrogenase (acetylating)
MPENKIKVAIIGTGNIGTDLCARLCLDSEFEVVAFVGRRPDSPGLKEFEGRVDNLISGGLEELLSSSIEIDGVFDASSAYDHKTHWQMLQTRNIWAIDLTPSKIGKPFVPELMGKIPSMNIQDKKLSNYSMVTCGGQSSAPLLYAMALNSEGIEDVEVSSSIASLSAGPATRRNIDQYIQSTENLIEIITSSKKVKAILVLNPAEPPVMMRTSVHMKVRNFNLEPMLKSAREVVAQVQKYVPGYDLVVEPHSPTPGYITATVKVVGAGYALPEYAGNLDIINAAGVETARLHSRLHSQSNAVNS